MDNSPVDNTEQSFSGVPQNTSFSQPPQLLKNTRIIIIVIVSVLVIVIGILGYIWFVEQNNKNIQKQQVVYEIGTKAQDLYKKGLYKQSEEEVLKGLKEDPNNEYLLASIIYIYATKGNETGTEKQALEKAKPYIEKAIKLYPNGPDTLLAVGYITEINGEFNKALEYYERALKEDSKWGEAWFRKGHVLEFLNKTSDAYNAYDKAYQLDPKNPLILMAKGRKEAAQGNGNEAYKFFLASAQSPDSTSYLRSEAYTNAALIKRTDIAAMKDALELAKKAVEANPSFSPALQVYGFLLAINGDLVSGVDHLNRAIKANPRITDNYYYMAMALRGGGKQYYENTIEYFKYALGRIKDDNTLVTQKEKDRTSAKIHYELARTYSMDGGNPAELTELKIAVTKDASYKEVLRKDFNSKLFFQDLANNQEFLTFINEKPKN